MFIAGHYDVWFITVAVETKILRRRPAHGECSVRVVYSFNARARTRHLTFNIVISANIQPEVYTTYRLSFLWKLLGIYGRDIFSIKHHRSNGRPKKKKTLDSNNSEHSKILTSKVFSKEGRGKSVLVKLWKNRKECLWKRFRVVTIYSSKRFIFSVGRGGGGK